MNRNHLLLILLFSAIPIFFHFLTVVPVGTDSSFFYLFSCSNQNIPTTVDIPIFSRLFFEFLPCNLFLFKGISLIVLFLSSLIVAKTGELFDKKYGWTAGVLVFLSTAWIHFHLQVEDDILAYPILFLANYFFLRGQLYKNNSLKVLAVVLVLFVGIFIWKGALLYLVSYSFFFLIALIALVGSFLYIGFGAIKGLAGNTLISENLNVVNLFLSPNSGISQLSFGHGLGFLGIYLYTRKIWLFLPFFVAMLINIKWTIHLAPFFGVGLMLLVVDANNYRIKKGIVFKEWWANNLFVEIFVGLSLFFTVALSVMLLFQVPYSAQIEAVEFAVQEANGETLSNDWSYGYWIFFFGGDTNTFGGGWPSYTEDWSSRILLTENPEGNSDCTLLRKWDKAGFYGADIQVYNCEK